MDWSIETLQREQGTLLEAQSLSSMAPCPQGVTKQCYSTANLLSPPALWTLAKLKWALDTLGVVCFSSSWYANDYMGWDSISQLLKYTWAGRIPNMYSQLWPCIFLQRVLKGESFLSKFTSSLVFLELPLNCLMYCHSGYCFTPFTPCTVLQAQNTFFSGFIPVIGRWH